MGVNFSKCMCNTDLVMLLDKAHQVLVEDTPPVKETS